MYGYLVSRDVLERRAQEKARAEVVRLVLTVEEAAEQLGVSRTFMFSLIRTRAVESVKIGRLRRVPLESLKAYVEGLRGPTEAA